MCALLEMTRTNQYRVTNVGVESGEHSLVRVAMRNPLVVEQLGFLGKGDLGKIVRRKECLQLDHSQGGVYGDLEGWLIMKASEVSGLL